MIVALVMVTGCSHLSAGKAIVGKEAPRFTLSSIGGEWPALLDPGEKMARAYSVTGIPRTSFIDRRGILRAVKVGEINQQELDQRLALII